MSHFPSVSIFHKNTAIEPNRSSTITGTKDFDSSTPVNYNWSPATFTNKRRTKANFRDSSLIVYDIDNDPEQSQLTLDDAVQLLHSYKAYIYTSRNHQKDKAGKGIKDRYRIVLPLIAPITNINAYEATLKYYANKLGIIDSVDPACLEGSRLYYQCTDLVSITGVNSDPLPIPSNEELAQHITKTLKTSNVASSVAGYNTMKGALNRSTLAFLSQQPAADPWHKRFIAAAIDLMRANYAIDEAADELCKASPINALDDTDMEQLNDVYLNDRGEPSEPKISWPELVLPKKEGDEPYPKRDSVPNIMHLITTIGGMRELKFNKRMNLIEKSPGVGLEDIDVERLYTLGYTYNITKSKELLRAVISTMADENKYDPLIDSIDSVEWDGRSRFAELLSTLEFEAGTTEKQLKLYGLFLRKWLIGVVTKIFHPGSENNMLVFVGAQGAGKTRWFRKLAEPYLSGFIEAHINPEDKDCHLNLLKYFIWSVSELDTITYSKDVGAMKDFITKSEVRVRPAYGRMDIIGSTISSFCASVNSKDFLYDSTGNRRFLIIPVEGVNAEHTVDIMQLYAECKEIMLSGERQWFNREEITMINDYNEQFMNKSDILEVFEGRVRNKESATEADSSVQKLTLKGILDELNVSAATRAEERSLRDWLTKKGIKTVNHSGVKKYLVDILPKELNTSRVRDLLSSKTSNDGREQK